jgi:cytochrome P450
MFHLGHLLVLPVTVIVVYILALAKERLRRAEQRRRLINDHGCEPAPVEAQRSCLSGIDSLLESYKHKKRGTYLLHEQQCFKRYGNTYSTTRLGMEVLNTIDPENVERIMRSPKTFIARPIRKIPLGGLVGHGILTADGDVWKRQRTIMKPSFHHKRIGEFEMYEEHMHRLIANIPHDGRPIDLQELFFKFTIDTSTAHLFGESCRSLAGQSELSPDPEFAGAFDRAQRASVTKFALASVDWLRPQLQYWKDIRCIKRFADRYVKKALQQKHDEVIDPRNSKYDPKSRNRSSPNFLQSLTELTDDHDEIRTGLLNLLVGGRDTTASLLSNLWLSLSQDQRIWGKLCAEVASLEGVWPDVEALKRLPYLRQCIDECR